MDATAKESNKKPEIIVLLVIVPFYGDKRIALLLFDTLLCTLRLKGGDYFDVSVFNLRR